MDSGILANQPIVLDNGSSCIRGGFAGEPLPSTEFPSYVGHPKHDRIMVGALEGSSFVGKQAQEHRGLMALEYPMKHGVVTNWEGIEAVWQHFYSSSGLLSEEHPVLLTEPPFVSEHQRAGAAGLLFETFNVPACYFVKPGVLSLYATGKITGLSLDAGDGVASCLPVYQGHAIRAASMRSDLAGSDVTNFLQLLLRKQGIKLMTSSEREIVKEIKELHSLIEPELAQNRKTRSEFSVSQPFLEDLQPITYKLPDGQKIKLNRLELARGPELLFRPHIFGSEEKAMHQLVLDAISRSDIDLRSSLYENIVLSGGTTLTRGFGDRLLNELKDSAPGSTKLRIFAPSNRIHTVWIGGSILAGLSTFKKMWISAQDYEYDPNCIHRL